jgi:hypothetical protein
MKNSIDYLINEVSEIITDTHLNSMQYLLLADALKRAREMHKQEIMNAFSRGLGTELSDWETSEQYYERIYNQKQHIIDIMKADEDDGLYNQNK